jgi:hypothetical protein
VMVAREDATALHQPVSSDQSASDSPEGSVGEQAAAAAAAASMVVESVVGDGDAPIPLAAHEHTANGQASAAVEPTPVDTLQPRPLLRQVSGYDGMRFKSSEQAPSPAPDTALQPRPLLRQVSGYDGMQSKSSEQAPLSPAPDTALQPRPLLRQVSGYDGMRSKSSEQALSPAPDTAFAQSKALVRSSSEDQVAEEIVVRGLDLAVQAASAEELQRGLAGQVEMAARQVVQAEAQVSRKATQVERLVAETEAARLEAVPKVPAARQVAADAAAQAHVKAEAGAGEKEAEAEARPSLEITRLAEENLKKVMRVKKNWDRGLNKTKMLVQLMRAAMPD